jgi:RimJ/RimL family protein N-acetyltransferase
MDVQPNLAGARALLRPWLPTDAEWVCAACQDPDIQRWTTVPSPYRLADAVEYVTSVAPQAWADGGAVFAVADVRTGELAGAIGAHGMHSQVAHVGYWTAPATRGRGVTSDALRTLTEWFLTERGAARVELVVEPSNGASIRVAEAAGFVREGVLRQRLELRGRQADVVMYSRLPSDPAPRGTGVSGR